MLRREIRLGKPGINRLASLMRFRKRRRKSRRFSRKGEKMPDLASPRRQPEDLSSVVLLESSKGAELHLRSEEGTLLRVPLGDADHLRGLAALAMMAGALGTLAPKAH